jgi:peroxiredoxin Q/BCP
MARKSPKKSASKTDSKRKVPQPRKAAAPPRAKASTKTLKKSAKPAPSKSAAATLNEGDRAPNFTLQRDGDSVVRLADFSGRKLVIFFYPRADTPGCTLEAIDFTRHAKEFEGAGTGVVGISADDVRAQTKFRDKHALGIPLPTPISRPSRRMEPGAKNPCMARPSSGSFAQRFWSAPTAGSLESGDA